MWRNLWFAESMLLVLWIFQIFGTMIFMVSQDTYFFEEVDLVWFINAELTPFFWSTGIWVILFIAAAIELVLHRMNLARNQTN